MTSSAAARLFSITELVELVILNVTKPDEGEEAAYKRHSRDIVNIFALQRVNRTFNSTINGSSKVRRLIGLDYHDDSRTDLRTSKNKITPLLQGEEASIRPFLNRGNWEENDGTRVISVSLRRASDTTTKRREMSQAIGIRGIHNLEARWSQQDSWREVKLTAARSPVRLVIWEEYDHGYIHTHDFDPSAGTLGALMDVLHWVSNRGVMYHALVGLVSKIEARIDWYFRENRSNMDMVVGFIVLTIFAVLAVTWYLVDWLLKVPRDKKDASTAAEDAC